MTGRRICLFDCLHKASRSAEEIHAYHEMPCDRKIHYSIADAEPQPIGAATGRVRCVYLLDEFLTETSDQSFGELCSGCCIAPAVATRPDCGAIRHRQEIGRYRGQCCLEHFVNIDCIGVFHISNYSIRCRFSHVEFAVRTLVPRNFKKPELSLKRQTARWATTDQPDAVAPTNGHSRALMRTSPVRDAMLTFIIYSAFNAKIGVPVSSDHVSRQPANGTACVRRRTIEEPRIRFPQKWRKKWE
jgi:hypothetical protein